VLQPAYLPHRELFTPKGAAVGAVHAALFLQGHQVSSDRGFRHGVEIGKLGDISAIVLVDVFENLVASFFDEISLRHRCNDLLHGNRGQLPRHAARPFISKPFHRSCTSGYDAWRSPPSSAAPE